MKQKSSQDLWVLLRQVLGITNSPLCESLDLRPSHGECQVWAILAYRVLTSIVGLEVLDMSTVVKKSPLPYTHKYLSVHLKSNEIVLDGTRLERLLRRETKRLRIKDDMIPSLYGVRICGSVLGSAGDYAVLDGTADQFFPARQELPHSVQETGFYGHPQRAPKLLCDAYAEGHESTATSDYLCRYTEKVFREALVRNRNINDYIIFGIWDPLVALPSRGHFL